MAQKLEEMLNEVRYPSHIETDKNVNFNGTMAVTGDASFAGTITIHQLAQSGTAAILLGSYGTATVAGGSAVVNKQRGLVTTTSLTTGTLTTATFDLVNNALGTSPQVFLQVYNGTNTTGVFVPSGITKGTAGSIAVILTNVAVTPANGTVLVDFEVAKS